MNTGFADIALAALFFGGPILAGTYAGYRTEKAAKRAAARGYRRQT